MHRLLRGLCLFQVSAALAGATSAVNSPAVVSKTHHSLPRPVTKYVDARKPYVMLVVDFRATGERQTLATPRGPTHFIKSRTDQQILLSDGSPTNETMYYYAITVVSPRALPVLLVVMDIPVESPDMVTVNLHDVTVHRDRRYGTPFGRLWLHGGANTVRYEMTR